jgi:hypothetical protein
MDIKRICSLCGVDRTNKKGWGGIMPVNDRRGESLGLFGECCYRAVLQAVDESPRQYKENGLEIREKIIQRAKELTS